MSLTRNTAEDPSQTDYYGSVELSRPVSDLSDVRKTATATTTTSSSSTENIIEIDQASETEDPNKKERLPMFAFILTRRFWIILILGQLLSLSIVATNTFTTYLTDDAVNIPAFQTLFNYVLLNLFFTPYTIYRYGWSKYWRMVVFNSWKYFLLSFADVEGNYFVVKAYQYTNLLSAELLDNWAIAVVVILSFIFLKVRYHWSQVLGTAVCIAGMVLVVVSDLLTDKNYSSTDMVKGDLFMLLGATCYGVSNTLEEFLLSKRPIYEVLSQMGMYGMIINGVQAAIFERDSIRDANWSSGMAGWFVGYTLCLLFLYLTAPILFRMSSAAFYNLSLLTSDFWGLLIGLKVFGYYVYWLYPVGFVFTVAGMIIYNMMIGSWMGEAEKPWLGENQRGGIVGVGTAKRTEDDEDEVDDVELHRAESAV
ncbi:hypothetical protein BZA70DRAFT_276827 [Myxozyma melibiosi]|uniref:DUF914-domain-containing protein n=1 Tax=Myxozyma melibiosi TaxID=54550 RepID=A0ABR1F7F2_9ASCO